MESKMLLRRFITACLTTDATEAFNRNDCSLVPRHATEENKDQFPTAGPITKADRI